MPDISSDDDEDVSAARRSPDSRIVPESRIITASIPDPPHAVPFAAEVCELAHRMRGWRRGELRDLVRVIRHLDPRQAGVSMRLTDDLCQFVDLAPNPSETRRTRSPREARITRLLRTGVGRGELNLEAMVHGIGPLLQVRRYGVRDRIVWSEPDQRGWRTQYCDPDQIDRRLREISGHVSQLARQDTFSAAVYGMVAVMAVHPLFDGNGRLGRVIFNTIFQRRRTAAYIPLFEIGVASRGGWLLSMRRAELTGDWLAMGRYLWGAVEMCVLAQRVFDSTVAGDTARRSPADVLDAGA